MITSLVYHLSPLLEQKLHEATHLVSAMAESLELRLVNQYLAHGKGLNGERTNFPEREWRFIRTDMSLTEAYEGRTVVYQAARKRSACQLLQVEGSRWVSDE